MTISSYPSRHESFSVVECPVGIDIVGEDRETIIHHKAAARAEKHQRHQLQQQQKHQHQRAQDGAQNQSSSPSTISPSGPAGRAFQSNGITSFSFTQDGSNKVARQPPMQVQGLGIAG